MNNNDYDYGYYERKGKVFLHQCRVRVDKSSCGCGYFLDVRYYEQKEEIPFQLLPYEEEGWVIFYEDTGCPAHKGSERKPPPFLKNLVEECKKVIREKKREKNK